METKIEKYLRERTTVSSQTIFLWSDLHFLKLQTDQEIIKSLRFELLEIYFKTPHQLNLSEQTQIEIEEYLKGEQNPPNAATILEKAIDEMFEKINGQNIHNSFNHFAVASIYCKRLRNWYLPIPDVIFQRVLEEANDNTWKLIGSKERVSFFRKSKKATPGYYLCKSHAELNVPFEEAMVLLSNEWRYEKDPTVINIKEVEKLGPDTNIISHVSKFLLVKVDYCFLTTVKTFPNGMGIYLSCSVDHVKVPETSMTRGIVPLFGAILKRSEQDPQNHSVLTEISYTLLDQKIISLFVKSDWLMSFQVNRLHKQVQSVENLKKEQKESV